MALQLNYSYKGVSLPAAYLEVVHLALNKIGENCTVHLRIWTDTTKQNFLEELRYSYPYNADATVAWAYAQLKLESEFAGATDILEEGQQA